MGTAAERDPRCLGRQRPCARVVPRPVPRPRRGCHHRCPHHQPRALCLFLPAARPGLPRRLYPAPPPLLCLQRLELPARVGCFSVEAPLPSPTPDAEPGAQCLVTTGPNPVRELLRDPRPVNPLTMGDRQIYVYDPATERAAKEG